MSDDPPVHNCGWGSRTRGKKTHELTHEERGKALDMLQAMLSNSKSGSNDQQQQQLPKGAFQQVGDVFHVHPKTISRLWKRAQATVVDGQFHALGYQSQKKQRCGRKRKYNDQSVQDAVRKLAPEQKSSYRTIAAALNMPLSSVHRLVPDKKLYPPPPPPTPVEEPAVAASVPVTNDTTCSTDEPSKKNGKKTRELTDEQRLRALFMLKSMLVTKRTDDDDKLEQKLPRGAITKVAKTFQVHPKTISRLWKQAEATADERGQLTSTGIQSKKGLRGRKRKYNCQCVQDAVRKLAPEQKISYRTIAAALNMPPSSVHRMVDLSSFNKTPNNVNSKSSTSDDDDGTSSGAEEKV